MNHHIFSNDFSPLRPHQVHLWLCDFSELDSSQLDKHCLLLSPAELLRVNQFHRRRAEALATRLFVRLCLANYAQIAPNSLEFQIDENGKPNLLKQNFSFNLSHSKQFALLGVSLASTIGVDLQEARTSRSHTALAERYFHSLEVQKLNALPSHKQNNYFFRLWTLKEAFFKALGTGIATGLDKVCFEMDTSEERDNEIYSLSNGLQVDVAPSLNQLVNDWQFAQFEILDNFHSAIAVQQSQPLDIQFFNGTGLLTELK